MEWSLSKALNVQHKGTPLISWVGPHKIGQQPARRLTPVGSEPTAQQCLNHASANYEQPHKITPTDTPCRVKPQCHIRVITAIICCLLQVCSLLAARQDSLIVDCSFCSPQLTAALLQATACMCRPQPRNSPLIASQQGEWPSMLRGVAQYAD